MLGFAAKFMDNNDQDQAAVQQLIAGLDGIYVRELRIRQGRPVLAWTMSNKMRQAFQTPEWSPMVHDAQSKGGESTDVMMKMVNGEPHGIFVLNAEPKELTIVLILGPIRMDQLSELKGLSGLGALGDGIGTEDKADKDKSGERRATRAKRQQERDGEQ